jgi:hypothetical protein
MVSSRPHVVLPSRELEEFVHQLKLSPQMLNPVVLFRLELQDQLFELSVFGADLLLNHVGSVL